MALFLAAVLSGCGRPETEAPVPRPFQGPLLGAPVPEFAVASWIVGSNPLLAEGRRRPRVILFWNHRDPGSQQALALVERIAREHGEQLSVLTIHTEIGVNEFESPQLLRKYIAERGLSLPTAYDRENDTLRRCRFPDVPALLFVDAKGIVRGMMDNYQPSRDEEIAEFTASRLLGR